MKSYSQDTFFTLVINVICPFRPANWFSLVKLAKLTSDTFGQDLIW